MAAEPISIRVAEIGDTERLADVSLTARGIAGSAPLDAIRDQARLVLVAEAGGAIVGWAKTHRYLEHSGPAPAGHYLGGVNVRPEFQRLGIGRMLSSARVEWVRERAAEVWYFTNARNRESIALHAQLGFVEVARAPEFHGTTFDGGTGILFRLLL